VKFILDQLPKWQAEAGHPLEQRLDLERIGMSGHSFGAQTTQAVSGQSAPVVGPRLTDDRIRAAVIMSPSIPQRGEPAAAFGKVQIPWLLLTGTHDDSPIGKQTPASRLQVYPALPPGDKYELVLDGAEHSVFTDRPLPGESRTRKPEHHRSILGISTAFWDACLKQDAAAKDWLNGTGPRKLLDPADRWQHK
jgi:predicted dienelactone hydrolase